MTTALLPGQAAAPPGPADMRMMYLLHHGFRRDLARFAAAVQATPADDRATWAALLRRWDLFATLLHDHHHKEDEHLWPLLRDRSAEARDLEGLRVLEEMEAEHATIDPLLAEARAALAARAEGRGPALHDLVDVFDRAATELGDHLSHEERDAVAILQRRVDGAEWDELERRKFRGGLAPKDLLNLLPWSVEGLPDAVTAPLLAEAGLSFRLMLLVGRPRFRRLETEAFRHVPVGVGA